MGRGVGKAGDLLRLKVRLVDGSEALIDLEDEELWSNSDRRQARRMRGAPLEYILRYEFVWTEMGDQIPTMFIISARYI